MKIQQISPGAFFVTYFSEEMLIGLPVISNQGISIKDDLLELKKSYEPLIEEDEYSSLE